MPPVKCQAYVSKNCTFTITRYKEPGTSLFTIMVHNDKNQTVWMSDMELRELSQNINNYLLSNEYE